MKIAALGITFQVRQDAIFAIPGIFAQLNGMIDAARVIRKSPPCDGPATMSRS